MMESPSVRRSRTHSPGGAWHSATRIISTGLLAGFIMFGAGIIGGAIIYMFDHSLEREYGNPSIFRQLSDPAMPLFFFVPFLLGVILAWLWTRTKTLFSARTGLKKGIAFGVIYWLLTIPGMLLAFASFSISAMMVISWGITVLVQAVCAGMLFSIVLK